MCVRAPANALHSVCSPQSKSIYCEANGHGRESKQAHGLIRVWQPACFRSGPLGFLNFSLAADSGEVDAEVQAFSGGVGIGTWRLCKHRWGRSEFYKRVERFKCWMQM